MKKSPKKTKKEISKSKKLLFNCILILIPIIILVFFEIVLRLSGYGDNLHLFVNHPDKENFKKYKVVNPNIGAKYFNKLEYTLPAYETFLKDKPDSCFRIFVLGSSTVVGFPYGNNLMFPRILHQRLQDAYPDKYIEVINTAITAVNSYTLLDFMSEIVKEKPDAILIYAGHNEFYGAFGIGSNETTGRNRKLTMMHIKLMNFKLYRLLKNTMQGITGKSKENSTVHGTLMKRIVKKSDIIYNSEEYKIGIEQYRKNLIKIIKKAQKKDIPVFLSDLISNIKDIEPFNSIRTSEYPAAIDVFHEAQKAEKNSEFKRAKMLYYKAKDLDCVRFRASSDINKIIREISSDYKVHYVPMLGIFEKKSVNELIGNNLLIEHVHPNISGYFLMADVFLNEIVNSKIIGNEVNKYCTYNSDYYKRNWGYTEIDSLSGFHQIENLKCHWPYRDESQGYIDYRLIYKPKSLIDSIAFKVVQLKDYNLYDAHKDMARIYRKRNDYYNAFREYNALAITMLTWPDYYVDAAKCLLYTYDLPMSLDYFNISLLYKKTFDAYYHGGEIYLIKNDLKNAVLYFNSALKLASEKEKINVMIKLYAAYVYDKQNENAQKILNSIHQQNPKIKMNLPSQSYTYQLYIPVQVSSFIAAANKLIKENKSAEACNVLLASLQIKDTPVANRLIGEYFLQTNNIAQGKYYLEKVYKDFETDPAYLQNMIGISLMENEKGKAKKYLERLKSVAPDYPPLKDIERYFSTY